MPSELINQPSDMGYVITALKNGAKARRRVWPKGVFIYLVKPSIIPYQNLRNEAKQVLAKTPANEDNTVLIGSHIDMRTQDGSIVIGWQFTTNDALAEDWEVMK